MDEVKAKKIDKPWITEVEKEVDEIRGVLQEQAEKIGWDAYWKESWKRAQEGLEGMGLGLVRDKAKGGYVVGSLSNARRI